MKFSLTYITPLIVLFSLYTENNGAYSAVFVLFVLIPLIELFTKGSTANLSKLEEELEKENKVYDWMLYGLVPLQYLILIYFLFQVSNESLSLTYKIGATTAYGMACGILGINAAHELGHRSTWYEQLMSKLLLLTTLYMHFFIEHNRGHHKNVSTDLDPASSMYGETVYAFYVRTIVGSYGSAWHLEKERLKRNSFHFGVLKMKCWSIKYCN